MAETKTTRSARTRARDARRELAERKKQQEDLIETHQVAFFDAADEIDTYEARIAELKAQVAHLEAEREAATAQARERQEEAIGALVVETSQSVDDVAILLGVSETRVKKARTAYRRRTTNDAPQTGTPTTEHAEQRNDHVEHPDGTERDGADDDAGVALEAMSA